MAKPDKREEAVQLRLVERLSIKTIATKLCVAKSSVSLWVREYPLTKAEISAKLGSHGLRHQRCKFCKTHFDTYSCRQIFCSESCRNKYKYRKRITNSEHVVHWRRKLKQRAVEYKGGKCQVCGYSRCIRAMKFHHIDPEKKDFQISKTVRSWEKVKVELDKCLLVCGNCHDEIHDGLVDVSLFTRSSTAERPPVKRRAVGSTPTG